jgi:cellulose synthase/poly-beta-1,6-N-acetylglucosamine synthase-like glycosyltransferase
VGIFAAVLGSVFASFGLYQLLLASAAFRYRPPRAAGAPTKRVTVLVPAHDEEALIRRCVESLNAQAYPRELFEVVVIADNCTDDTAEVARKAGASVLVRNEPGARGKGHALRWAIDRLLAREWPPDAIAVVDADSVADPAFLQALVRPLEEGAPAAQGESLLFDEGSPGAAFRAGAFLLVNRVRPAGRAVLGLPCNLQGNGMLFSTDLLRAHPWEAFSATEDLEYSINLLVAGVEPRFVGGAVVQSPSAPSDEAATHQQLRWEGGKLHVARTRLGRVLAAAIRRRDAKLLEVAFDLAVPPLGLLTALAATGTVLTGIGIAVDFLPWWPIVPWAVALAAIPLYVLTGFRAAKAPPAVYRSLARAPLFVLKKLGAIPRLARFRPDSWVRTERDR